VLSSIGRSRYKRHRREWYRSKGARVRRVSKTKWGMKTSSKLKCVTLNGVQLLPVFIARMVSKKEDPV